MPACAVDDVYSHRVMCADPGASSSAVGLRTTYSKVAKKLSRRGPIFGLPLCEVRVPGVVFGFRFFPAVVSLTSPLRFLLRSLAVSGKDTEQCQDVEQFRSWIPSFTSSPPILPLKIWHSLRHSRTADLA